MTPRSMIRALAVLVLSNFLGIERGPADDWPQWLGPRRDGVWRESGIVERFPDGGPRLRCPSPYTIHQRILSVISIAFFNFLREHPFGKAFFAPLDVILSEHDVVEPDFLYISNERSSIITEKNIQGAPDLVVEVLSRTTRRRDKTLKRDLYERSGVLEYWVIDPRSRSAAIYRREGERFAEPEKLTADAEYFLTTLLLPGLEISLVDVFAE